MKSKKDALLFLKTLNQEGIKEVYVSAKKKSAAKTEEPKSVPAPKAVSAVKAASASEPAGLKDRLIDLQGKVRECTLCKELVKNRTHTVFGSGNVKAQLMFIGEAPGRDEDQQGLPFVGRAGQLLTKIIESIGLDRRKVFIANVLKCRPPQNRPPQPDEIINCEPFLLKQVEWIRPKIICALGTFAAQTLLKSEETISNLRGSFRDFPGVPGVKVLCTYHPAYLLRNPGEKAKVWEDMKKIKKELESL